MIIFLKQYIIGPLLPMNRPAISPYKGLEWISGQYLLKVFCNVFDGKELYRNIFANLPDKLPLSCLISLKVTAFVFVQIGTLRDVFIKLSECKLLYRDTHFYLIHIGVLPIK